MITCPDCTPAQQYVLEQLQTSAGVEDKTALAVLMGNIEQESRFTSNICEGGAIVPYDQLPTWWVRSYSMDYSGIVMMVWVSSVKNTSVIHPAWKVKLVI